MIPQMDVPTRTDELEFADLHNPDVVLVLEASGTIRHVSASVHRVSGWAPAELLGRSAFDLLHPDDLEYTLGALLEAVDHPGEHGAIEVRMLRRDGTWVSAEVETYNWPDDPEGRIVASVRDITARHALPERRRALERATLWVGARCAGVSVDGLDEAMAEITERLGELVEAHEVLLSVADEAGGRPASWRWARSPEATRLRPPIDGAALNEAARSVVHPARVEVVLGDEQEAHVQQPVTNEDGGVLGLLTIAWHTRDARRYWDEGNGPLLEAAARIVMLTAQRVQRERRLAHDAVHDPLTGLGNRARLAQALEHELHRSSGRDEVALALAFCDLDRFKQVNDTWGHDAGDEVLVEVAGRLAGAVRHGDLVCRVGGDEFVVLCPGVTDERTARVMAERIAALAAVPVRLSRGAVASIAASIGVVLVHGRTESPLASGDVLRAADQAMYEAKTSDDRTVRILELDLSSY